MSAVADALRQLADSLQAEDGGSTGEAERDLRPGQENVEWQIQQELGLDGWVAQETEKRGVYTAERLQHRKPELYKASRNMLEVGMSPKTIGRLLSLDIRTVNAVRDVMERENAIPPQKERTLKLLRATITAGLEELFEDVIAGRRKLSPLDLAVLMDKELLLSGGATSRMELVESPEARRFREFMEATVAKHRAGMVLEGENVGEKGWLPAGLPEPREREVFPVLPTTEKVPIPAVTDSEPVKDATSTLENQ
jgi:hypothetical protein